jgi:hypothetical protein
MSLKKGNTEILIKNKRVIEYFSQHTNLDIEKVLLNVIDLFEKSDLILNENNNRDIFSLLNEQTFEIKQQRNLLQTLTDQMSHNLISYNTELCQLKATLSSLTVDITGKIYETKDKYIYELKDLLKFKESDNILNLNSTIEKQNIILTDKLSLIINELLLKNNISNNDNIFGQFKLDLLKSLNSITENDPNKLVDKLSSLIETKTFSLLTTLNEHLLNNISQTESRLTTNLTQLKEISSKSSTLQENLSDELSTYLNKYKISNSKGIQSENLLFNILIKEFSSSEIIRTSNEQGTGDIVMKRSTKIPIMFENKDYIANVNRDEIDKFIRDITNTGYNGVLISQHSGIVGKNNLQIDIHNNNVLIYIHNMDYNIDILKLSVAMIDMISDKMEQLNDTSITIPPDTLKNIIDEYQDLIYTKERLINGLKEYYKRTMEQFNEIKLTSLNQFIGNYNANIKTHTVRCELCNVYETSNLKSLARHKTSCKTKLKNPASPQPTESLNESSTESHEDKPAEPLSAKQLKINKKQKK